MPFVFNIFNIFNIFNPRFHYYSLSFVRQMASISVLALPQLHPKSTSHHVNHPPTSFNNPWPSFGDSSPSFLSLFKTRFSPSRNFVPVPENRQGLVPIRKPDWGDGIHGLKATWIGHASWYIETTAEKSKDRGVRVFFDPVFSERVSPVGWAGPRRFSPVPCELNEVPEVDAVVISHNHYDHLDLETIRRIYERSKGKIRFLCALGIKRWFLGLGYGISEEEVVELDWWEGVRLDVEDVGSVRLTCMPSQHTSGRSITDAGCALWCSWVLEEATIGDSKPETKTGIDVEPPPSEAGHKKLYFAGDTGYRTVTVDSQEADVSSSPYCPAFAEVGELYGPFDLALLPIGCYAPRSFMSGLHCSPQDSIEIHKDIKSKKSVGMHFGTIRGGISSQWEPVTEPPELWKKACVKAGLAWETEIGLCDIGGTVAV